MMMPGYGLLNLLVVNYSKNEVNVKPVTSLETLTTSITCYCAARTR